MGDNNSTFFSGSIDLTELLNQAKQLHPSFSRGNNGKAYASVQIWVNEQPDDYGQHLKIKLNLTKEQRETAGDKAKELQLYVGRAKRFDLTGSQPLTAMAAAELITDDDDLPF